MISSKYVLKSMRLSRKLRPSFTSYSPLLAVHGGLLGLNGDLLELIYRILAFNRCLLAFVEYLLANRKIHPINLTRISILNKGI